MNLSKRQPEEEDIEINMSPMIDMVFLLLIFFIVASIVVQDKVKVDIPAAVYAKVPENIEGRLLISVNKQEEMFVGMTKVTLDQLRQRLNAEIAADPKTKVEVRADGAVPFKVNQDIMTACADAGIVDMIFAAYEK